MKGRKTCVWALVSLFLIGILFITSCSDKPEGPVNLAPEKASNPTPANLEANIPQTGLELQWDCTDPEGDSIFYDVYIGPQGDLAVVDSNIEQNHCFVDYLLADMIYYWRVVARDQNGNESISPIWSFSTANQFEFLYPIELGYQWEYARQTEYFNFDPPEIESLVPPEPEGFSQVTIEDQVDMDGNMTYEFHQYVDQDGDIFERNSYYANQYMGLLYFGSDSAGVGIGDTPAPIRNPKRFVLGGMQFNSIDEMLARLGAGTPTGFDGVGLIYANPLMVLYYPLEIGSQWNYRGQEGDLIWVDKQVMGTVNVDVPAGSFECFEIQWFYDYDKDGHWDEGTSVIDYICAAGLVKRVVTIEDIDVVTYDNPTPVGTMDLSETIELTGYSLRKTE